QRTLYLQLQKFRVIRFWNNEVLENLDGCLKVLLNELSANLHPSPADKSASSPARGEVKKRVEKNK
ncbi:MAG TPA: DUF559 domain-containing protein, partial [Elusimicrobiales bacterium]|nr:DUF559 domain-containing protein [Elusimicrobiales bacterium]